MPLTINDRTSVVTDAETHAKAAAYWGQRVKQHLESGNWQDAYFLTIVAASCAEAYFSTIERANS